VVNGGRGHTEHAHDGDKIEIYLESRSLEDLRDRRLYLLIVIPAQARDDVRAALLVKCMWGSGFGRGSHENRKEEEMRRLLAPTRNF
jgi:hypothetical protein